MKSISPYLFFDGTCREAMTFYKEVFGGELIIMDYKDAPSGTPCPANAKDRVMHSALKNGSFTILASDTPEGPAQKGGDTQLYQEFDKLADFERTFQALSKGGKVFQPPHDAFWGSRFAMLTDRYGFSWMLSTPCGQQK